jgi:hypothetical protein
MQMTALITDESVLITKEIVRFLPAGSGQRKRDRRGIDTRAIAFRARTDPFGFL